MGCDQGKQKAWFLHDQKAREQKAAELKRVAEEIQHASPGQQIQLDRLEIRETQNKKAPVCTPQDPKRWGGEFVQAVESLTPAFEEQTGPRLNPEAEAWESANEAREKLYESWSPPLVEWEKLKVEVAEIRREILGYGVGILEAKREAGFANERAAHNAAKAKHLLRWQTQNGWWLIALSAVTLLLLGHAVARYIPEPDWARLLQFLGL